ncbi:MAG: tetratricopeptide repeat protein [Acidobacteriota bacterium]
MRALAAILILSLSGSGWTLGRLLGDTSSRAAVSRGLSAFAKGDFKKALQSFSKADQLNPSARTAFNLGTTELASGDRQHGSVTIQKAMADPGLKPGALYNRGSSELQAKEYDPAIRSLIESLRLRPNDPAAKRNLEIAQLRKRQQQQQQGGGGQQKKQQSPNGQQPNQRQKSPQQQKPAEGANKDPGKVDAESVLRSVEQQEREELSRMRRAKRDNEKIGW